MAEFDQEKALREEIMGLGETLSTLKKCENAIASELEAERSAIVNARGLIEAELERKVLKELS